MRQCGGDIPRGATTVLLFCVSSAQRHAHISSPLGHHSDFSGKTREIAMMTYTHVVPTLHVPRPCTVVAIRTSQMARFANCCDCDFPFCCLLVASHVVPCFLCLRQFNWNCRNKDSLNVFNQVSLLAIALRVCGCFGSCYVVLCMHAFSLG